MKRRKKHPLGQLSHQAQKALKEEIRTIQRNHGYRITPAGRKILRKYLISGLSVDNFRRSKFGRGIPPVPHKRRLNTKRVQKINPVPVINMTRESFRRIIATAEELSIAKFAQKIGHRYPQKSNGPVIITAHIIKKSIETNWCQVFPFCNFKSARELGLTILNDENDEE